MIFFRHRVNTLAELEALSPDVGLEFDLRSDGQRVIVTHDPFTEGPSIEDFFPRIGKRPCIFNVKCDGIEARVRSLAQQNGIERYFFLDCAVPTLVKMSDAGERRFAVRYSEVEPFESVMAWAGRAEWVWVDCFTNYPLDEANWQRLSQRFKICLVSPELQGHGFESIPLFRTALGTRHFDAVCGKRPAAWSAP